MSTLQRQIAPTATSSSAADTELRRVFPSALERLWPEIGPKLAAIADRSRGRWTVEPLLDAILDGRWQLWVVWNRAEDRLQAIVGTEIYTELSGKRFCGIRFATGDDRAAWMPLLDELEQWARENGCDAIDGWCRRGWEKHLPAYTLTHVLLEKDL